LVQSAVPKFIHHMLPADHARNWDEFMDSLMWTFDSDAPAQHGSALCCLLERLSLLRGAERLSLLRSVTKEISL